MIVECTSSKNCTNKLCGHMNKHDYSDSCKIGDCTFSRDITSRQIQCECINIRNEKLKKLKLKENE